MELVEGEDLAERLKRGAIPLDESLAIAKQIADALEEAHERGIVHRDLKPANVKITPDGKVKVLDFGLAKAMDSMTPDLKVGSAHAMDSPTFAHTGTQVGVILGTAAYMAPEQARGKPVDKRADIWAFGAVLFEMLSGRRVFQGETVSDVMAATLREEIDWSTLPPATPDRVRQLLGRCLERDPKQRLRDIGEARVALELAPSRDASDMPVPVAAPRRTPALNWIVLAGVAAVSALLATGLRTFVRSEPAPGVTRLSIPLPPGHVLSGNGGPAISPDGRTVAYAARDGSGVSRLYLRALDRFDPTVVADSEGAQAPFFSPDGKRVGFFARAKLLTASVAGGAAAPLADASAHSMGATWGDDDTIVFAPALSVGLRRVPASGGTVQQLTLPDEGANGYAHARPQFLPGGRTLLFTIWGAATPDASGSGTALLSMDTGKWIQINPAGVWTARYADSGHLLLSGSRGVRAAAFDSGRPKPTNPQTFVVDEVFSTIAWSDSWFSVSKTGTLAYVPGDFSLGKLAWIERDGRASVLTESPVSLVDPALSPDGERIAIQDRDNTLWVMHLRRGSRVRLTLDGEGTNAYPVWSADGTRIVFSSNRSGDWEIYSVPAGGGSATRLLTRKGNQFALSYAPDGTLLFNERYAGRTGADLWTLAPDGKVAAFLDHQPASKAGGQFSPDGRAVAYISDETGRDEIYVRPFGPKADVLQVSTDGGTAPRWSPDGKELFYRRGDAFMSASVTTSGDKSSVGDPRKLFEVRAAAGRSTFQPAYSVSPDGRRFLVHLLDPRAVPTQINVVLNWFEELKQKVPPR
jgi:serine/threonine-protein kinase